MNKAVQRTFSNIRSVLNRYEAEISATLADYRQSLAAARQNCAKYKNEAEEFEKARKELISPARSRIAAADATMAEAAKDAIAELRSALAQHVTEKPDPAFVALLRDYQAFGVKLDRVELEALALQGAGSYVALRLLAALAAQSGFKLSAPVSADFEKDVKTLEALTVPPLMLCPVEYVAEAADVLEDVPHRRADGSIAYQSGRPTSTYLAVRASLLKNLQTGLAAAADRWGTHFLPTLAELEPIKDASGEAVTTPAQQRAEAVQRAADNIGVADCASEELAHAIAAENEKAEQRAAEIRAKFARG